MKALPRRHATLARPQLAKHLKLFVTIFRGARQFSSACGFHDCGTRGYDRIVRIRLPRQADLLAKISYPRIAAKHRKFGIIERSANPERPQARRAIQRFQSARLVSKTGENYGLLEWLWCKIDCKFLRVRGSTSS